MSMKRSITYCTNDEMKQIRNQHPNFGATIQLQGRIGSAMITQLIKNLTGTISVDPLLCFHKSLNTKPSSFRWAIRKHDSIFESYRSIVLGVEPDVATTGYSPLCRFLTCRPRLNEFYLRFFLRLRILLCLHCIHSFLRSLRFFLRLRIFLRLHCIHSFLRSLRFFLRLRILLRLHCIHSFLRSLRFFLGLRILLRLHCIHSFLRTSSAGIMTTLTLTPPFCTRNSSFVIVCASRILRFRNIGIAWITFAGFVDFIGGTDVGL
ncbi:hypothetical protein BC938DRAFT_477188 [Jimgerdemannia flammicorona]|uniref:Uncharacterized protein n=1 Tax=Jimgerdemannia flammicorona TaxID=994334 RepID=A0A433QPM3_9FUNG|nr:hypothetical protein BC938DRAFT_477188 [Jimgerdemannia flammicorona]